MAGGSELVLVRGKPDSGVSPTRYAFDAPRVVHFERSGVTPLITGLAWSDGGDVVIGYGYTRSVVLEETRPQRVAAQTIFRCGVLPWNADEFIDVLVDWDEQIFARDPSVAASGAYPDLRIHYAYDALDGVRLASSTDGGHTFSEPRQFGPTFGYMPTVIARGDRVDLFHLATTSRGTELFLHQWEDFEAGGMASYRLTTATSEPVREFESASMPGANWGIRNATLLVVESNVRQVGRFGYDVTRAGDELHVVIHEDHDVRYFWIDTLGLGPNDRIQFIGGTGEREPFEPATPPPLAEGLTGPLPAPQTDHRHQLRLLRLR